MNAVQVTLGFGLHCGWAIEGAIGSEYKIDASYLRLCCTREGLVIKAMCLPNGWPKARTCHAVPIAHAGRENLREIL